MPGWQSGTAAGSDKGIAVEMNSYYLVSAPLYRMFVFCSLFFSSFLYSPPPSIGLVS